MKTFLFTLLLISPIMSYGYNVNSFEVNSFMEIPQFIEMQQPNYQIAKQEGMSNSELCFLFPFLHQRATKQCDEEVQKIYAVGTLALILKARGAGIIKGQQINPLKGKDLVNTSYLIVSSLKDQGWTMEGVINTAKSGLQLTPIGRTIEDIVGYVQQQIQQSRL